MVKAKIIIYVFIILKSKTIIIFKEIHSFNKYVLNTYNVQELFIGEIVAKKTKSLPCILFEKD